MNRYFDNEENLVYEIYTKIQQNNNIDISDWYGPW